jgi:hypothetical protein
MGEDQRRKGHSNLYEAQAPYFRSGSGENSSRSKAEMGEGESWEEVDVELLYL